MRLPEVTEAQIDEVIRTFGLTCDTERRAALLHRDTVDIRACAGSGKTTLLVAKLAILVPRWQDRFRGICVLSHTNVAHEEIRQRFAILPALRAVETYPHYLGTVQSFINLYLGTPGCIEVLQVRPGIIDDEEFARRAERLLERNSYTAARNWLAKQRNGDALLAGLTLQLAEDGTLVLASVAKLPGPGPAVDALQRLKGALVKQGVFRYEDMDTLGLLYAKRHPEVAAAIARRFPAVFFDEAQDTVARQADLLGIIFGGRSVVQRFGDDRQAIYSDSSSDSGAVFPLPGHLSMKNSLRFSPSIASIVQHVCVGEVEPIAGNAAVTARRHTVFLFTPARIKEVLPAFARVVAAELGPGLPPTQVAALGFRRRGSPDPSKVPLMIGDYWESVVTSHRSLTASLGSLAEYAAAAQADLRCSKTTATARTRLLQATCRILELQGLTDDGRPFTPTRLLRRLETADAHKPARLLLLMGKLLLRMAGGEATDNRCAAEVLLEGLKPLHQGRWDTPVQEFCSATPAVPTAAGQTDAACADGIFGLETENGHVEVAVSTIHAVKGQTLEAALVLCTYYFRFHDLRQLVAEGLLRGARPSAAKARQVVLQGNAKRIYVAMTRPRQLLCLAMCQDHISTEEQAEMQQLGWQFQTV